MAFFDYGNRTGDPNFAPPEERLALKVPAEKDRPAFNNNAGYTMRDLEDSVAAIDPRTLRRFRQQLCADPLAKRIVQLHKASLSVVSGGEKKTKTQKELRTNEKTKNKKSSNQSSSSEKPLR
jgi:hypothetical protein